MKLSPAVARDFGLQSTRNWNTQWSLGIKEMGSQDIPPSGLMVMAKAADYVLLLHIEDFSTAEGWLHCFHDRHEIVFCTLLGESKNVSSETCGTWQNSAYLKAY